MVYVMMLANAVCCSLSHTVVAACVVLLEAGLSGGQVLVPHGATQPCMIVERGMEVCGVAGSKGADTLVTKCYIAAGRLEGFLQ